MEARGTRSDGPVTGGEASRTGEAEPRAASDAPPAAAREPILVCPRAEVRPCPLGLTVEDCDTLRNRSIWLVHVRWYVVFGALAAVAFGACVFPPAANWPVLAGLVSLLGAANAVWTWRARAGEEGLCGHVLNFASQQMLVDFGLLTAAVHFTGGVSGPLLPMFVLHGVFSALLLPKRHTAMILGSAAVLLLLSAVAQHLGGWRPVWRFEDPAVAPAWLERALEVAFVLLATGGATWLGLHLARMVRERHRRIATLAAELRKRNDELRQVDEQRLRLLGVASHDLRSPLAAVESRLDLILNGFVGETTPPQREQLLKVKGRLRELRSFINDLLDLTAVESSGAPAPEPAPVDVVAQVREVVAEMLPLAEASGSRIDAALPDRVLPVGAPAARLGLVWSNLLSNAIKYGQGRPVEVTVSADAETVRVTVRDYGIGISAEDRERLFTEFFRSRTARESGIPGTGLGLAISARVIRSLGGSIDARSRPGEGTTFVVSLPLLAARDAGAAALAG